MMYLAGLFLFFLWCVISPFLPKDSKTIVVHNDVRVVKPARRYHEIPNAHKVD